MDQYFKKKHHPTVRAYRYFFRRFPRLHFWMTILPRMVTGMLWISYAYVKKLGKPLKKLDHSKYASSDTVFIMATGSSINDYPESRWATIRAHNSIGMNFFLLHDHVPTYYVMENMHDNHRKLLSIRADDHANVPLILSAQVGNLHFGRLEARLANVAQLERGVLDRTYLSLDLLPAGNKEEEMVRAYRMFERVGLFKVRRRFRMLTKRRGSVTHLINLAVRIGYEKTCCAASTSTIPSTSTTRCERISSRAVFPCLPTARPERCTTPTTPPSSRSRSRQSSSS